MSGTDQVDADLFRYAHMQKSYYDSAGKAVPEQVVGSYDYHENVPYETQLLYKYGDLRRPILNEFQSKRAIDIGCGEGRMVRRMQKCLGKVDGADISPSMIELARSKTPGSEFWETDGTNCGDAPSDYYDFAFCTISLQHICVFETRDRILKDVLRVLKPDGKATFQYIYAKEYPYVPFGPLLPFRLVGLQLWRRDHRNVRWRENKTNERTTNGGCNVLFGERDLDDVRTYFREYFENVEFWFYDISIGRGGWGAKRLLPDTHPNSHLTNRTGKETHFVF